MNRNRAEKRIGRRSLRISDLLAILVLLIFAISLLVMGIRYVCYLALDVEKAVSSTVVVDSPAQMLILRVDYPIPAGAEGEFLPSREEGERVKEGDQIGSIQWEGRQTPVYASHGGLVSYKVDGWEGILQPDQVDHIDWLSVLSQINADSPTADDITAGSLSGTRIVARVSDNLIPPTLFFNTSALPQGLQEGSSCRFSMPDAEGDTSPLQATVTEIGRLADGSLFFFAQLDTLDSRMYAERSLDVSLIEQSIKGITIPLSAVQWDETGQQAFVYRCDRSRLEKVEISLIYQTETEAVVEGLTLGDHIITNPERAREGQRIYLHS